jgi:IS5 family transposase
MCNRTPKEKSKRLLFRKKKRHTLKIQILIDTSTNKIICIAVEKGRCHDFKLFKDTVVGVDTMIKFLADSGYQGIQNFFPNSEIPNKKSKKNPLNKTEKKNNRQISKNRIFIEHVNSKIKIFRIMSERYRNRHKRFGLRANLICGLYNYELSSC